MSSVIYTSPNKVHTGMCLEGIGSLGHVFILWGQIWMFNLKLTAWNRRMMVFKE